MDYWIRISESTKDFKDFITNEDGVEDNKEQFSDGSLLILNSNYRAVSTVRFRDLFPVSLTSLDFEATDTDINYFTAQVSFKYTIYDILGPDGRTHMTLDEIQDMWKRDSIIDPDNLHDESLKIPQLHHNIIQSTIQPLF